MRKSKFIFLLWLPILLLCTGCWVPLGVHEHPEYDRFVGKKVRTLVPITVQKPGLVLGTIGFYDKHDIIKNKLMTIPTGSVLKITGMTSRRLEPGICYYFRCKYVADGNPIVFDYEVTNFIKGKWYVAPYFIILD